MKSNFTIGNKVRLVSGGPVMTIRGLHFDVLANEYRDNTFDCIWFDRNKDGKSEVYYCPFSAEELVSAETPLCDPAK